jgi:hypothetical protein
MAMTEQEWLACKDPAPMLDFLRDKASDRKLRLFAVEGVRQVSEWLVHPNSKAALEASERVAEGVSSPDILAPVWRAAWDVLPLEPYSMVHVDAARAAGRAVEEQAYEAADLTKNEVVGLFASDRLPIFADALEDAGCDNADILNHCRQPGEHVRGCWVVDLVLGKS